MRRVITEKERGVMFCPECGEPLGSSGWVIGTALRCDCGQFGIIPYAPEKVEGAEGDTQKIRRRVEDALRKGNGYTVKVVAQLLGVRLD